jgi:hypothetical protein
MKTITTRFAKSLVLGVGALLLAACGGGGSSNAEKVRLVLYSAPLGGATLDPFSDATKGPMQFVELDVRGDTVQEGTMSQMYHFSRTDGGVASLTDLPFEESLQIVVRGYPASSANESLPSQYPIAVGRSDFFIVRESADLVQVPLYLSRVNAFSPLATPSGTPGGEGVALTLPAALVGSSITALPTGDVLVVGGATLKAGVTNPFEDAGIDTLSKEAWIYSPSTGTIAAVSPMNLPRAFHTATLLPDGQVLVAGGLSLETVEPIPQAELYDPYGKRFVPAPALQAARARHQATLLASSDQFFVFLTGGEGGASSWEVYDPSATGSGAVTNGTLHTPRWNHADVFVDKGLRVVHDAVYITGGENNDGVVDTIEFFDAEVLQAAPKSVDLTLTRGGTTLATATFNKKRGFVFVAGGFADKSKKEASKNVELFALDKNEPTLGISHVPAGTHGLDLQVARGGHRAVALYNGDVLFVGGAKVNDTTLASVTEGEVLTELTRINACSNKISVTPIRTLTDNGLPAGVALPAVVSMTSGNVLVLGGATASGGVFTASNQAMVYAFDDTPKVAEAAPKDTDGDGIGDDGDGSGAAGDNPCVAPNTSCCDDNCPTVSNPDQTGACQ